MPRKLKTDQIPQYLDAIKKNGFVEIQDAFDSEQVEAILKIIERPLNTPAINGRKGYIQFGARRFLSETLSWGKPIVDLYTDPAVIEIADRYTGDETHLSYYRIYRASPSKTDVMHWHVDNKIDTFDFEKQQFVTKMIPGDKGVNLVLYLSDVDIGGFQLVPGSHLWTSDHNRESWDSEIHKYRDQVLTLNNRPKNTLLLFDYRCIHRAQPFTSGGDRTSLLAQYYSSQMPVGEPIILNARDMEGLNDRQRRVLNFGKEPSTENWPVASPDQIFTFREWLRVGYLIARRKTKELLASGNVK